MAVELSGLAGTSAVLFELDGARHALPAACVDEIVRAVAVSPLPGAPAAIRGLVDRRGEVVPVLDLRQRFGLPSPPVSSHEHLIFARAGGRRLALRVDQALALVDLEAAQLADAARITTAAGTLAGVVKLPDGMVLLHDPAAFLEQVEGERLDALVKASGGTP